MTTAPPTGGRLLTVLANPPLTAGTRTLRRVELAAELLGFQEVRSANLFAHPSHATGDISVLGANAEGWLAARPAISDGLATAAAVLLAYGTSEPTGEARTHFRQQVTWLEQHVTQRRLPTWQVGDGPRHPSRWQRWTYRNYPDLCFPEALRVSLLTRVHDSSNPD